MQERFFLSNSCRKYGCVNIEKWYFFFVQSIRLQGYDGASSLCGEWNGLEALISSECPYAYYVHCLVHRLQLTLVAASKEIIHVHQFFYQVELHCQYCWSIM